MTAVWLLKLIWHYWLLLKIIVSIKHLVTSNGELLIVYNIERNGSFEVT